MPLPITPKMDDDEGWITPDNIRDMNIKMSQLSAATELDRRVGCKNHCYLLFFCYYLFFKIDYFRYYLLLSFIFYYFVLFFLILGYLLLTIDCYFLD